MGKVTKVKTSAWWSINLDCDCPNCGEVVDLLADYDFRANITPLECDTPRTTDMEVECPNCKFDFLVDLGY